MDAKYEETVTTQLVPVDYFENLPVEIILHICSFLDAKFICNILSQVCKRFCSIFNDDVIWKSRIFKMHNGHLYPVLPVLGAEFDWRQACIDIEWQQCLWRNKGESQLKHRFWKDVHYAAVDAIHLLQHGTICATGGRDRSIVIWNLSESRNSEDFPPFEMNAKAHTGWIWNFVSFNNTLFSCSWDTFIRCWSLQTGLQESSSFKCDNAVLSMAVDEHVIVGGLYNSRVFVFDTRAATEPILCYHKHRRSILALAMDEKYIISASDDQTLAVWDRRAGKNIKHQIKLVDSKKQNQSESQIENAFPMCMSYKNNCLYVGDSKGKLHLINPLNGKFELVQSYDVGHTGKLTSVDQGTGYLMTGSTDGTIRVLTPTNPPQILALFKSHGGEVTGLSYQDNILATSGTNCAVELWIPSGAS